jgi:hypothetical protein
LEEKDTSSTEVFIFGVLSGKTTSFVYSIYVDEKNKIFKKFKDLFTKS